MDLGTNASFGSQVYTPDRLIAHSADDILGKGITLLSGQVQPRGAVLGKIAIGAATSAAKSGGNTGNGTLTLDATTPVLLAKAGIYTARCIAAATNSGTFEIKDPNGSSLGEYTVGATFADQIKFVIADGTTDFVVGDGFDITVAAGSGKYVLSIAAATDGSQNPSVILAQDCDATAGDAGALAYFDGTFNASSLTIGAGHTVATVTEALRGLSINVVTTQGGV